MPRSSPPKVAIVHEWFVNHAGSEKVVEQILQIYPQADLFALVDFLPEAERAFIGYKPVQTSFIQKLPFAKSRFRSYLPLFPLAVEQFDLRAYDIVISSSHAVAKGALTNAEQLHICYCHSPMRYVWDLYHQYMQQTGLSRGIKGFFVQAMLHYVRNWDYLSANRVNHYVANSAFIGRRIQNIYNQKSDVVYPPVAVDQFECYMAKEDFYLTASRMVPYKKIGLIVEAFNQMPDKKLIVVGNGPEQKAIKATAASHIVFLDYLPFEELKKLMQRAKAFVFAAEEDFGITLVEAQACGTPVITYGRGGALETVVAGQTGVFFNEQTPASIRQAIADFESNYVQFDPLRIRQNAERFSISHFREAFQALVAARYEAFCQQREGVQANFVPVMVED